MINWCPAELCNPDPCKNDGECVHKDLSYGYYCRCNTGYFGPLCEFGKNYFTCIIQIILPSKTLRHDNRQYWLMATTGCVELFLLACYILITRVYERILPCMYCITMFVTQNAVCNCEIKSILTYLAC